MRLNIYGKKDGKRVIVKTYEAETYDMFYGTVEDFLNLIDMQDLKILQSETVESNQILGVADLVKNCFEQIAPLLMDVFEGLTSDELRHAKLSEVVAAVKECILYSVKVAFNNTNSKNV